MLFFVRPGIMPSARKLRSLTIQCEDVRVTSCALISLQAVSQEDSRRRKSRVLSHGGWMYVLSLQQSRLPLSFGRIDVLVP